MAFRVSDFSCSEVSVAAKEIPMQRVSLWGTLYFLRGGKRNAKQDRMEGRSCRNGGGHHRLAEAARRRVLVGSCEQRGETLVYVLPDGRKFHLTAAEK